MSYREASIQVGDDIPSSDWAPGGNEDFVLYWCLPLGALFAWTAGQWVPFINGGPGAYPVGSIFSSTDSALTDPSTVLHFGTWQQLPSSNNIYQWERIT